jgi:hypothetical protein
MNRRILRTLEVCLLTVGVLTISSVTSAFADTITLSWNPNTDPVTGYRVHVGVQSGSYTQHYDAGATTTFTFTTATPGQRYCFAVSAYSSAGESPNSSEACGYSNAPPTLTNPGNQSSSVGQPTSLQLAGSDPESRPLIYSVNGLPPGLSLMAATGYISGQGTTAGTYSVTASASDGVLTTSQPFTWTMATAPVSDTTPPSVTITVPTSAATYATSSTSIPLSGSASDNSSVSQVTWVNDRGGNGMASGTTTWSVASVPLAGGANVITVQARDGAGNLANDVLTVTMSSTPPADSAAPTVAITAPTSASTYSVASESIVLTGTSSDDLGVSEVTWANNRGGSGTATGTASWNSGPISLKRGTNVITVTAHDAAGHTSTDTVTVTRTRI